jgi:hypothetical protein
MIGSQGDDLLAFELDQSTGELFAIELMLQGRLARRLAHCQVMWSMVGLPVFDVSGRGVTAWIGERGGSELFDLRADFSLELAEAVCRIMLWPDEVQYRIRAGPAAGDRVVFEFNSRRELCGVIVTDLTAHEYRLLRDRWL